MQPEQKANRDMSHTEESGYDAQDLTGADIPLPNFTPPGAQAVSTAAAPEVNEPSVKVALETHIVEAVVEVVSPPEHQEVTKALSIYEQSLLLAAEDGDFSAPASTAANDVSTAMPGGANPFAETLTGRTAADIVASAAESVTSSQAPTAPGGDFATAAESAKSPDISVPPQVLEALLKVANQVPVGSVAPVHSETKTQGHEQMASGVGALAEGAMVLGGGLASLGGAAAKALGNIASSAARGLGKRHDVMPTFSAYRVGQTEKAEAEYQKAAQKLWSSGELPSVRQEIEARASSTGLSVADVVEKMSPGGEMADLHERFVKAIASSPDARAQKKAMDKSLDSWIRQFDKGQEELLNPEGKGSPLHESLRERFTNSQSRMEAATAEVPLFEQEDKAHAQKLREAIQAIVERIKEAVMEFANMFRGGGKSAAAEKGGASLDR